MRTDPGALNVHDLGIDSEGSAALGINDKGSVVGVLVPRGQGGTQDHAFLATAIADYVDLNRGASMPVGVRLTRATGINNAGQIVADGSDSRCYLLTPIKP